MWSSAREGAEAGVEDVLGMQADDRKRLAWGFGRVQAQSLTVQDCTQAETWNQQTCDGDDGGGWWMAQRMKARLHGFDGAVR